MSVVDDFLGGLPAHLAAEFARLRGIVVDELDARDLLVVEFTSYNLPTMGLAASSKQAVCGFGAGKKFLSWYPFSGRTITTLAGDLAGFETTKGSVHFTPDAPLPEPLVRRLVAVRLDEVLGQ